MKTTLILSACCALHGMQQVKAHYRPDQQVLLLVMLMPCPTAETMVIASSQLYTIHGEL